MNRSFVAILIGGAFLLLACQQEPDQGDLAAQAARLYYEQLVNGKYDTFVDGHFQPDSIPGNYRSQLIENAKMFMGQQNEEHQGIKGVRVAGVKADTARHMANVFLVFHYGDSTHEEIVVPMIRYKNLWYMK